MNEVRCSSEYAWIWYSKVVLGEFGALRSRRRFDMNRRSAFSVRGDDLRVAEQIAEITLVRAEEEGLRS